MDDKRDISSRIERCRQLIKIGLHSIVKDGPRTAMHKTKRILGIGMFISFRKWARTPLYTEEQLEERRRHRFSKDIKFSIISPLYNTPEKFLREMIESVLAQTYPDWELCMADGSDDEHSYVQQLCLEYAEKDHRIRYKKLETNLGLAGNYNACIDMAKGQYISILDHDDILHPAALHDVMIPICKEDADFIYTDEMTFISPNLQDISLIHFKPDYAPDNLRANNYICHFTSISKVLIERCGAFREGFDGSQDHELFLRLTDEAEHIVHVPKPLYYWRAHAESTASSVSNKSYAGEAGVRAVKSYLDAAGIRAQVESIDQMPTLYRVSYEIESAEPMISIIIPNCEHVDDLKTCIESIEEKTTYSNYEIIIAENNSRDPGVFRYYEMIKNRYGNVSVVFCPVEGFNWAEINNYAIREAASGEYILLLNNDMELITPDWLQELLMHAQRPEVGMAGAKLYFPDGTIQHAGVILGLGGVAAHTFHHIRRDERGYMNRLSYTQDLSAVTGACMLMRRTVFEEVGGIDENFSVGYNDIDLCLKVREKGYLIVWTPFAELYHYESKSRGLAVTEEELAQARYEKVYFFSKWNKEIEEGDPYYNPNLSLYSSCFEMERLPHKQKSHYKNIY